MTDKQSQAENPTAHNPVSIPAPDTATAPAHQTGGNGNILLTVLVVLAVLLGGYSFYRTIFPSHIVGGIAVVDSDRLAAAYLQEALANIQSDSPEQSQQKLAAQLAGIQNKLDELSASGRIVVRKSAVLTYPPEADMTEQVAAELGIKLLPVTAPAAVNTLPAPAPTATPVEQSELPGATSGGQSGSELD